MFSLCFPFPLVGFLAGGAVLMLGAVAFVYQRSRQGDGQVDGNETLIKEFAILAVFTVLVFVFFVFAWAPC